MTNYKKNMEYRNKRIEALIKENEELKARIKMLEDSKISVSGTPSRWLKEWENEIKEKEAGK